MGFEAKSDWLEWLETAQSEQAVPETDARRCEDNPKDLFLSRLLQKPCGKVNFNLFWTTKQSLTIHRGTLSFSLRLNCSNMGGRWFLAVIQIRFSSASMKS